MPRPRRGAYIYRRPGKVGWYAFLDWRRKDISLRTDDETEALDRLAKLQNDRRLRALAPNDRPLTEVFAECLDRSATNHTRKTAYEIGLNSERILAWLDGREVVSAREVDLALVEDYKTARHRFEKRSAARVNRELDTWKKAMRVAVEWGAAHPSVLAAFVKLREPRPQPHQLGLTKRQLDALLRAETHAGYRALFRLTLGTGMRDDEVRHLDRADLQPPWIVVSPKPAGWCVCCPKGWTSKGYRYRSIPASRATTRAAREFLDARLNLDQKAIWKRLRRACAAAKVPRASMQDLRYAFASHTLAAGHRIEDVSRWLGHRDLLTTMRYLRVVNTATPRPGSLPF